MHLDTEYHTSTQRLKFILEAENSREFTIGETLEIGESLVYLYEILSMETHEENS
jgi:hypothetical protein